MKELQWSSDGCPNDCGYCKEMNIPCVYTENGKQRNYYCALCGKKIAADEAFSYRDIFFCGNCIDKRNSFLNKIQLGKEKL